MAEVLACCVRLLLLFVIRWKWIGEKNEKLNLRKEMLACSTLSFNCLVNPMMICNFVAEKTIKFYGDERTGRGFS